LTRRNLAATLAAIALTLTTMNIPVRSATVNEWKNQTLTLTQAREYMVSLINRDRAANHLPPVILDTVGTEAAQKHTNEMSARGYVSHWNVNGCKPEARYTACGGKDAVYENVTGWYDGVNHSVCPIQTFTKQELETVESDFMNHEGHRENILDFAHNRVGIGLTLVNDEGDRRVQCAQEFIDQKGTFNAIPQRLTRGVGFSVAGKLGKDVTFEKVQVMWEPYPKTLSIASLNNEIPYEDSTNSVATYTTKGESPVCLSRTADGDEFVVTITPGQNWKRGTYYVWVWARTKADKVSFIVSNRTALLG
jgi:uncharacterized protein YkwD